MFTTYWIVDKGNKLLDNTSSIQLQKLTSHPHYSRCFCSFLVHKKVAIKSFLEMHLKCKFYNGLLLGLEIHGQNSLGKVVSRHQIPP